MFGIGGRAFTHAIERDLDVDFVKAEAMKLALSGHEPHHKADIEKAIEKTLNVWINGVELALSEFPKLDHLPHRILLCGGGSSLEMLVDKLESADWHKGLPFTRKPIIQHIKPDEVVGITDSTGSISDHTYITAMGLLRVGMDTLGSAVADTADSNIRGKLNRLLRV
jgi:cell division protein FtsA